MTTTATDTTPAATLAADGQAALNTAKDHLVALEKAAAQGLEVSATDFNTAVTDVDLKTRRQAFLNKAHTAESTTYLVALFDAAERIKTAAQADVDAIQAILDRAKRLATDINTNATHETYGAAVNMNLPLVDYLGDEDGLLAIKTAGKWQPLSVQYGDAYRLQGRVFTRTGEIVNSNHNRPARG